jgi:hypothetical protein
MEEVGSDKLKSFDGNGIIGNNISILHISTKPLRTLFDLITFKVTICEQG